METTLHFNIPLKVNELADLIRQKLSIQDRQKLAELLFKDSSDDDEPTKEQLIAEIKQAVREVNLVKQGKMKARPVQELLDEL
ncbi:MAG: hypothetical protein MUE30_15475 [Spirosomaceae bacterium]|jgi:hypothetical protein|nr:hypothetical protein [Spirosomataceae bacterium]